MKTKIQALFSSVLFFCSTQLNAEIFNGGIIVGLSTSSVKISKVNDAFVEVVKGKNILGVEGGFFAKISLNPFYLKPMILANYQNGTVDIYNRDGSIQVSNYSNGKLEVPVLLGIRLFSILGLEAGPVYNWMFHENNDKNTSIRVDPSGFGYRVGTNIQIGRLFLGLNLHGITHKSSGSSTSTFQSPDQLIFNIGIELGKKE